MSKDARIIVIALAVATVILVGLMGALHSDLVDEIRVGDGHVNSFVGSQHDTMKGQ